MQRIGRERLEVAIELGRGPEHDEKVARIDRRHLAVGDPALDNHHALVGDLAHVLPVRLLQEPRAVDDLAGEKTRFRSVLAGIFELCADIVSERVGRLPVRCDRVQGIVPTGDQMGDNRGIDLFLGREVVIDIGLGQAGCLGDFTGVGAPSMALAMSNDEWPRARGSRRR